MGETIVALPVRKINASDIVDSGTLKVSEAEIGSLKNDDVDELTPGHGIVAAATIAGDISGNAATATAAAAVLGLVDTTGTDVWVSHDEELVFAPGTSYVKKKTIQLGILPLVGGNLKVYFELKHTLSGNVAYGRIYKNGAALGTERTDNTGNYQPFTEVLNFAAGDAIQLYCKSSSGNIAIRNFRILGTIGNAKVSKCIEPTISTP
jgi:hypothetical protein